MFDALNLIKRIRIKENLTFEMRLDAVTITNTPQFSDYSVFNTDINSTNFGRVTGAGGARWFAASLRLNF